MLEGSEPPSLITPRGDIFYIVLRVGYQTILSGVINGGISNIVDPDSYLNTLPINPPTFIMASGLILVPVTANYPPANEVSVAETLYVPDVETSNSPLTVAHPRFSYQTLNLYFPDARATVDSNVSVFLVKVYSERFCSFRALWQ